MDQKEAMMRLTGIQEIVICALVEAGGEMPVKDLKHLYSGSGDGLRVNYLVRLGFAEWVRPEHNPVGKALAMRITDSGRALAFRQGKGE